ncbi:MAG: DUF3465 domain-containing protein [Candidatus Dormibacteraceae bacterium]
MLLHRNGAEVTFNATLLDQPQITHFNQRFLVRTKSGDLLEIDHNVDLAEQIPLHSGDQLLIHGQLYLDPEMGGVHCTHQHTSRGCPQPGFILFHGHTYD